MRKPGNEVKTYIVNMRVDRFSLQMIYNSSDIFVWSNEKLYCQAVDVGDGRYVPTIYVLINLHSRNQSTVV